jgi:phage antirepressor YoqD-like protein
MKKSNNLNRTTTTIKERVNTTTGYKITSTTTVKTDKSILDILIDFLS